MEKYRSVIHSKTGNNITAFILENDATWVGREKEIFHATPLYCEDGQIIEMIFVKTYIKKNKTVVYAYFRKKAGEQELKINISGESKAHKVAKENIYEGICSGKIKINGKELNKEKVKNISMEYRTSSNDYIIPDVIILFKEEDSVYGKGIFIEIQLSNQTENETDERSYDRLIRGLSGVWLGWDDFDNDMNVIGDDIKIKPYKILLNEIEDIKQKEFLNKINRYGEIVDDKMLELKSSYYKIYKYNLEDFKDKCIDVKKEIIEKISNEILEGKNIINNQFESKINEINKNKESINDTLKLIQDISSGEKNLKQKALEIKNEILGIKNSIKNIQYPKLEDIKKESKVIKLIEEVYEYIINEAVKTGRESKNKIIEGVWKR